MNQPATTPRGLNKLYADARSALDGAVRDGMLLAIGGFGWLILSFAAILAPQYQNKLFGILQPAFFGEIALTLWLVIKGAKPPAHQDAAALSSALPSAR